MSGCGRREGAIGRLSLTRGAAPDVALRGRLHSFRSVNNIGCPAEAARRREIAALDGAADCRVLLGA